MRSRRTVGTLVIIAGLAVAVAVVPIGAGAASQLGFAQARLDGRKHVDRAHCPAPCYAADVYAAKRVGSQKIKMKGRSRFKVAGGSRRCDGRVIVTERGGRINTRSRGWSCRST